MSSQKVAKVLVLDATPLITQHVTTLQNYAEEFYTTPTVYNEIKDENARNNLVLWGDKLKRRHPKPESMKRVRDFARMTGDAQVLSENDLHIIALTYELECELNHGDWRLRKFPGEKLVFRKNSDGKLERVPAEEETKKEAEVVEHQEPAVATEKKKRRRGGKRQREKREAALKEELTQQGAANEEQVAQVMSQLDELKIADGKTTDTKETSETAESNETGETTEKKENKETAEDQLEEQYDDDDDCGDWITEENLVQEMIKDSGESTDAGKTTKINVALATGDFAVQNVSLQLGLNLMNTLSGLQIKRVRNYMLRCHACFTMIPIPKNGKPKHFCSSCGGNTLLRCAVSVDSKTGELKPHLKANFQWINRGNKYSIASPLSKNTQKRMGNKGFVHNKSNKQKEYNEPLLTEDQKEYEKAIKDDEWLRRHNEKILGDWIGGGSADNFISPFAVQGIRPTGVKVGSGKGRYANASRRKK